MRSRILTRIFVSAAIAITLGMGATSVSASDCYHPSYHYKTVTVYETVRKPVSEWIIKYDHCDKPYRVEVLTYRTVQVAVQKTVRVGY